MIKSYNVEKDKKQMKIKTSPSAETPLNRKGRAEKTDADMEVGRGEK